MSTNSNKYKIQANQITRTPSVHDFIPNRILRRNNRHRRPPIGKSVSVSFHVRVVRASQRATRNCVGVWERSVSQRWGSERKEMFRPRVYFLRFVAMCKGSGFRENVQILLLCARVFRICSGRCGYAHTFWWTCVRCSLVVSPCAKVLREMFRS